MKGIVNGGGVEMSKKDSGDNIYHHILRSLEGNMGLLPDT